MNIENTFQELSLQPRVNDITELFRLQETLVYKEFTYETRPDGNFVCPIDKSALPAWVKTMYPNLYAETNFFIFLKNKGGVKRHIDVSRKCVATFPLVPIIQPTCFFKTYDDEIPYAKLTHGTKAYLQDVSQIHGVSECKEERIFFQIAFKKKTYQEMLQLI